MAINPTNLATLNVLEDNFDVTIAIVQERPVIGKYYEASEGLVPNRLVGFYDEDLEMVQLYLTDNTGTRYFLVS